MSTRSFPRPRRRRRVQKSPGTVFALGVLGLGLIGFSAFADPVPRFIWNASASAPTGLYRVVSGAAGRGALVLVRAPESVAKLAAKRGYLPVGVPLIKRIAAVAGDDVCAFGDAIIVNGEIVARQRDADRAGRPLPRWNECRKLAESELFLALDTPESFDSRYFGPVTYAHVIGRLVPLWTD